MNPVIQLVLLCRDAGAKHSDINWEWCRYWYNRLNEEIQT